MWTVKGTVHIGQTPVAPHQHYQTKQIFYLFLLTAQNTGVAGVRSRAGISSLLFISILRVVGWEDFLLSFLEEGAEEGAEVEVVCSPELPDEWSELLQEGRG